jgi:MoaA/NifB/PqqE/SkfB family radical SAM enzyme
VSAIKAAKAKGFAVNVNATIYDGHPPQDIAAFLDFARDLGVGVSISPGYAYERAPDQEHFLNRRKTKELFRDIFARGKGKQWTFVHSACSSTSWPATRPIIARLGHADAQRLRLAEALLSAGRGLCRDLQGADGDHRLGLLRHRPV